jgi:CRISPR-associated exonuclease Cas4
VHRETDDTLHWMIGDVAPPELQLALDADDECLARERERIWYVACTRARELLIVPQQSAAAQNSWARVVDLAWAELPALDLSKLDPVGFSPPAEAPNLQTAEIFAAEGAAIAAAATPITWLTPSDQDQDRMPVEQAVAADGGEAPEREIPVGAGRVRGLVLHKLMEEVLTGELAEDLSAFMRRAGELLTELPIDSSDAAVLPAAEEMGSTAWRTLHLAEIATLRPGLMPELPLYAMLDGEASATALAGRADAIAFDKGQAPVVLDWKSDVAPTSQDTRAHAAQLRDYMRSIGAPRGAVVYMTSGLVHWVASPTQAT